MAEFWSLRGLSWGELAKRTCRKSWEDEVFGQSARLAFYFFFAMFPVLLLLVILLGRPTGVGSELLGVLLDSSQQVLPPDASGLVANTTRQLNVRAVLGAGAILAGVWAAWGALNGTWAIMSGLNKAYEVEEERLSFSETSISLRSWELELPRSPRVTRQANVDCLVSVS
jgi:membrane protein